MFGHDLDIIGHMTYTPPAGGTADFELATYTPPAGGTADFELAVVSVPPFLIGFGVSGKLGESLPTDPLNIRGIYQMRMMHPNRTPHTKAPWKEKRPLKMKFYAPTNPQTAPQEANRTKFADAMAAWMALTSEQKAEYTIRAKRRQMFGWGLFIKEYYQAN
jgi:hypothetical protein